MDYTYSLAHHGIKGQRWGVRRYQNADGTLTEAGKKRYTKISNYRDKYVDRANRNYESSSKKHTTAEENVKDLTDNGVNSKAYKDWKERTDAQRKREFESEHSVTIDNITYKVPYEESFDKRYNDKMDFVNQEEKVAELIGKNSRDVYKYKNQADKWLSKKEEMANMPVDVFTKKRTIRKTFAN